MDAKRRYCHDDQIVVSDPIRVAMLDFISIEHEHVVPELRRRIDD